jgi:hypothetical protein
MVAVGEHQVELRETLAALTQGQRLQRPGCDLVAQFSGNQA